MSKENNFTGTKDCDGVEICEGHILLTNFENEYYQVIFDKESGKYLGVTVFEEDDSEWYVPILSAYKVVGNIKDNPELLHQIR